MSGLRFVRFYPSDWRAGCIGLTLEQEGLYIRICAYLYETEMRLSIDDSMAAKFMGLHTNAYRKIRDQLAALGKIVKRQDGWTVGRAEREIAAATHKARIVERQADQDRDGQAGENTLGDTPIVTPQDTPLESRGVFSENVIQINTPKKSHSQEPKKDPLPPKGGPTPFEALKAFEAYNATALRCGLPQAAKLTPDRQRKIVARLKDYGSDGWETALANIERSSFLTGKNDRGWRASLEFLLQPASFAKVHDGTFGNGRHADPPKTEQKAAPPRRRFDDDQDFMMKVAREMGVA